MKLQEIRAIAKSNNVDFSGLDKSDLIHMLQRNEGNFDCSATAYDGICDQESCKWREDCLDSSKG